MLQRIVRVALKSLLAVFLVSQLQACVDDNSDRGSTQVSSEAVVSGSVGDGPVAGATLNIFDKYGNLIQTETSNNSATYNARIKAKGNAYPLTIEAVNGIDLVTGRTPDFTLVSVIAHPSIKQVNINPFTTLIVEAARSMPGGLSDQNISDVTAAIVSQLNFGLDPALLADPVGSEITDANVADIVKSSEALGEMIRRARDALMATGTVTSADDVVRALADDISDGALDGIGGTRANGRISAIATLTSAQVLLEALSNNLRVDGLIATDALDNAILSTRPELAGGALTGDVAINAEMIVQARTAVAAARALALSTELTTIAGILDSIQAGSLPSEIEPVLPGDTSQDLDPVIALAISTTDEQLAVVNGTSSNSQASATSDPATATNNPPVISGTPAVSVNAGSFYSFQPVASDPNGDGLIFSIQNRPTWARFDSNTGRLSGTPAASDVGNYGNIRISVSDGTESAALPVFSLSVNSVQAQVASVTLSWVAPSSRADGSALALSEIAGYTLYYGSAEGDYSKSIAIDDPAATSVTVSDIPVGTYYFVMTTLDTDGAESGYSATTQKQIQ